MARFYLFINGSVLIRFDTNEWFCSISYEVFFCILRFGTVLASNQTVNTPILNILSFFFMIMLFKKTTLAATHYVFPSLFHKNKTPPHSCSHCRPPLVVIPSRHHLHLTIHHSMTSISNVCLVFLYIYLCVYNVNIFEWFCEVYKIWFLWEKMFSLFYIYFCLP